MKEISYFINILSNFYLSNFDSLFENIGMIDIEPIYLRNLVLLKLS